MAMEEKNTALTVVIEKLTEIVHSCSGSEDGTETHDGTADGVPAAVETQPVQGGNMTWANCKLTAGESNTPDSGDGYRVSSHVSKATVAVDSRVSEAGSVSLMSLFRQLKEPPRSVAGGHPNQVVISLPVKVGDISINNPEALIETLKKIETKSHVDRTAAERRERGQQLAGSPAPASPSSASTSAAAAVGGVKEAFKCAKCDYASHNKHYLKQHVDLVHTAERPFKCPLCDYAGKRSHSLKEHLVVHSPHRPYTCSFCSASFRKKGHLTAHVKLHATEQAVPCALCRSFVSNRTLLSKHLKEDHADEDAYHCEVCGYATISDSDITMHMHMHGNPKLFSCLQCGMTSVHDAVMVKHVKEKHEGEGTFSVTTEKAKSRPVIFLKCSACGFTTNERETLQEHMLQHLDTSAADEALTAPVTGLLAGSPGGDAAAPSLLKTNQKVAKFDCNQCAFSCDVADPFIKHVLRHKSAGCEADGKGEEPREALPVSQITAASVGTESRNESEALAVQPAGPFTHDVKTGIYTCVICGYACDQQRTIKAHIWRHSGHKNLDYPMFQNGPLSVYDDVPVGVSLMADNSTILEKKPPGRVPARVARADGKASVVITGAKVAAPVATGVTTSGVDAKIAHLSSGQQPRSVSTTVTSSSLTRPHTLPVKPMVITPVPARPVAAPRQSPVTSTGGISLLSSPSNVVSTAHLHTRASYARKQQRVAEVCGGDHTGGSSDSQGGVVAAAAPGETSYVVVGKENADVSLSLSPSEKCGGDSVEGEAVTMGSERVQSDPPLRLEHVAEEVSGPRKRYLWLDVEGRARKVMVYENEAEASGQQTTKEGDAVHANAEPEEIQTSWPASVTPGDALKRKGGAEDDSADDELKRRKTEGGGLVTVDGESVIVESVAHVYSTPEFIIRSSSLCQSPRSAVGSAAGSLAGSTAGSTVGCSPRTDSPRLPEAGPQRDTTVAAEPVETESVDPVEENVVVVGTQDVEEEWDGEDGGGPRDEMEAAFGTEMESPLDPDGDQIMDYVEVIVESTEADLAAAPETGGEGERVAGEAPPKAAAAAVEQVISLRSLLQNKAPTGPGMAGARSAGSQAAETSGDQRQEQQGISSSLLAVIEQFREETKTESGQPPPPPLLSPSSGGRRGKALMVGSMEENIERVAASNQQFRCKLCHYSSRTLSGIRSHMRMHKVKKPKECSLCSFIADSNTSLQEHMLQHCKQRTFYCKLCSAAFTYKSQMRAHMRAHNSSRRLAGQGETLAEGEDRGLTCYVCLETFASAEEVDKHRESECQSKYTFKCPECDFLSSSKDLFNKHMRWHGKVYKCSLCQFTTKNYNKMQAHLKQHIEPEDLQCDLCDFVATSVRSLKSHMKRHANDQRFVRQPLEQYKCNLCGYICHHLPALKSHMWRHASDTSYSYEVTNDVINAAIELDDVTRGGGGGGGASSPSPTSPRPPGEAAAPLTAGSPKVGAAKVGTVKAEDGLVAFRCCHCFFETVEKAELNEHMTIHMDIIQKTLEVNNCLISRESQS